MSEEEQNWVQILQVMYEGTMAVHADSLARDHDLDLKTPQRRTRPPDPELRGRQAPEAR